MGILQVKTLIIQTLMCLEMAGAKSVQLQKTGRSVDIHMDPCSYRLKMKSELVGPKHS